MTTLNEIRLGVADKQKFVHDCIHMMAGESNGFFKVNLKAGSAEELMTQLTQTAIEILVVDINFPLERGIEICSQIKRIYPKIKIVVFSDYDDIALIRKLYNSFASAYVEKKENLDALKLSLNEIVKNGFHYRHDLSNFNTEDKNQLKGNQKNQQKLSFSKQDIEIVRLIQSENTTKEIAKKLKLEIKTVEGHRNKLMAMTNSRKIVGVVNYFTSHGLLKPLSGKD